MKEYRVKDPVFRIAMQVFTNVSLEKREETFKINQKSMKSSPDGRMYFDGGKGICLIWLARDATMGTFIHELWHGIHATLRSRGLSPMNLSGEETYAYTMQYFYNEFVKQGLFKKKKAVRSPRL